MKNKNSFRPRISVVIPTKEEELTITDIIQNCKPHADEIIVVDGHSQDRTREKAASQDVRLYLIIKNGKEKPCAM